jgi:hypothetical protein
LRSQKGTSQSTCSQLWGPRFHLPDPLKNLALPRQTWLAKWQTNWLTSLCQSTQSF